MKWASRKCYLWTGYKLTKNRNSNDIVLSHAFATGVADGAAQVDIDAANEDIKRGINIHGIGRFVPHYTPNMVQEALIPQHIISKAPTELFYIGRSIFNKNVTTESIWPFK